MTFYKVTFLYDVKQIAKYTSICKLNKDQKPILFMSTTRLSPPSVDIKVHTIFPFRRLRLRLYS